MKCDICGYKFKKSSKKISICPNCGQKISSKKKKISKSITSLNVDEYFKGIGCSLEQKTDELKISRFVNGGDFYALGLNLLFVSIISLSIFISLICLALDNTSEKGSLFIFAIIFSIIMVHIKNFIHITFTVNSQGFWAKSIDKKEFFISREEIDYCFYKKVQRFDKYGNVEGSFHGVCIKLKNEPDNPNSDNNVRDFKYHLNLMKNLVNMNLDNIYKVRITTSEVDTGLCFNSKKPAKFLANEFNKYLGIDVTGIQT